MSGTQADLDTSLDALVSDVAALTAAASANSAAVQPSWPRLLHPARPPWT